MFWESESDYMLCLDNDIAFEPDFVMDMLDSDKEFIGGVYPSRDGKGFTFRPYQHEDGRIILDETGKYLKMEYIPAGCMLIKRSVIKKMREKFPELYFCPKDPRTQESKGYCFFDTQVWNGEFWGEDYVFCRRVREAGVDIWVNPMIYFNHAGIHGALIEALTTDPEKAQR
jgi:GT2 family glycosyltransferase